MREFMKCVALGVKPIPKAANVRQWISLLIIQTLSLQSWMFLESIPSGFVDFRVKLSANKVLK